MEESFSKLKEYAFKLLAVRGRSISEMRQRLTLYVSKKKLSTHSIEEVISNLIDLKLLNDLDFSVSWIEGRRRGKAKGDRLIEKELIMKGIPKDIILIAFGQTKQSPQELLTGMRKVIERKLRVLAGKDREMVREKLISALLRRGFAWGDASRVVDAELKKE